MLKIKKVKPLFNRIITTADKYDNDVKIGNIIDGSKSNTIKEYQKVISVGTTIKDIKEGDLVIINPNRYAVRKHQAGSLKDNVITDNPVTHYNFNIMEIDGKQCMLLYDSDIDYIVEDYTEEHKSSIIQPNKPQVIV